MSLGSEVLVKVFRRLVQSGLAEAMIDETSVDVHCLQVSAPMFNSSHSFEIADCGGIGASGFLVVGITHFHDVQSNWKLRSQVSSFGSGLLSTLSHPRP